MSFPVVSLAGASQDFLESWDALAARRGWFWHTTAWLRYQLAYWPGSRDDSFAVLDADGRVAAIVPLVLAPPGHAPAYAYRTYPGPLGVASGIRYGYVAVEELRRRARIAGVGRAEFCGDPFVAATSQVDPFRGAPVRWRVSTSQRVVELGERLAWSDVRSSYRPLIRRAQREYEITVLSGESAAPAFAKYCALHRAQYDRPRADETYRLQAEWLSDGLAAVALAEAGGVTWGAAYWTIFRGAAYYASGAYVARDVACAVVWESLCALSGLGVRRASLGWQGMAWTEKERNVEFFKRGFGGADVPAEVLGGDFSLPPVSDGGPALEVAPQADSVA